MQQLLLLHGAIGSMDQFHDLREELKEQYTVHSMNFCGHGGRALPDENFSIRMFADEVLDHLVKKNIDTINIFGYSMGGYVGMYLAKYHPSRINKLITLATKFHWDEATAERETKMLDPEKIKEKLPSFAETLKTRHQPQDWKQLLNKTAQLLTEMGLNNPLKLSGYGSIETPVKLMLGDRDKMVSPEETRQVFNTLPNAQLCIIPGTPHPIELVNTSRLVWEIRDFVN
ncbi:MAG: alpha/beta fold hydrolase [Chitinophagaceae bacterium]|nr:alpha/beta fold hydrolase [Chitinophagaceae bacterium]